MDFVVLAKKKRATWTQENMCKAIADVRHKCLSVNAASKIYDIPRRTLGYYLANHRVNKSKLGRKSTLTKQQEKELCKRIFRLAGVGFPLTSKMLKLNVFQFCLENKISNQFVEGHAGRSWLRTFLERNPKVRKRKAQRLNRAGAQKLNKFIVEDHFLKLQKILTEKNLLDFPEKIFNMDEKSCRLQLYKEVFKKEGSKLVHIVAKEHGKSVTIVACGNATGLVIPPMILFSGVKKNPTWKKTLPTGSYTKMTPKGSMTTETFVEFLKHFARFKPNGTCLLILDGAKSHMDYKICEVAEENNILLYCLPSNTAHELQPLDKSCFRSFEMFWDQHALLYFNAHKGERGISRLKFSDIFTSTWEKSMTPANMKSGFRATGIFPFNPFIISEEAFELSTTTELLPPNTDMVDNNLPSTSSATDNQPVAGTSGLQENAHQRHHTQYICLSSDSDSTEDVDKLCNPFSDDSICLDSPQANKNSSQDKSFTEMLPTPKRKKKTTRIMKPAINCHTVVLKKRLFEEKKEVTPAIKKLKDSTKTKGKAVSKKTVTKETENWYCTLCSKVEMKDMRLCEVCVMYVHEECVGITEKDKVSFICPRCVQ